MMRGRQNKDTWGRALPVSRVWLTLSTRHWRTNPSIHSFIIIIIIAGGYTLTHTAHSLFIENIWTQLPARQRGEQQFLLPLESGGGRTNRAVIYTREGKKLTPIPPHGSLTNMGVTEPIEKDRGKILLCFIIYRLEGAFISNDFMLFPCVHFVRFIIMGFKPLHCPVSQLLEQLESWGFEFPRTHILMKQMYTLNAPRVTLDKSACQMHKCVNIKSKSSSAQTPNEAKPSLIKIALFFKPTRVWGVTK